MPEVLRPALGQPPDGEAQERDGDDGGAEREPPDASLRPAVREPPLQLGAVVEPSDQRGAAGTPCRGMLPARERSWPEDVTGERPAVREFSGPGWVRARNETLSRS